MTRVPAFAAIPANPAPDVTSQAGARRLAEKIRDAWAKCGHVIETEVFYASGLASDARAMVWAVRTNLVGGLPPKKVRL